MNYSLNEEQQKLIKYQQEKLSACRKKIMELEDDVAFLKRALAVALKDSTIVIHGEDEHEPEFHLDENMSGELLIKVLKHGG